MPTATSWWPATWSPAATGAYEYGIYLSDADASENDVYGNTTGIREDGSSYVDQNRVYDNSGAGIVADLAAALLQNVVYSNLLGIETTYVLRRPDRQQPDLRQPQPRRADRIARDRRDRVHQQHRLPADRRRGRHRRRHEQRRPARQHPLGLRRLRYRGSRRQRAGVRQRLQRPDDQRQRPGRPLAGSGPSGPPLVAERRFHRRGQPGGGSALRGPGRPGRDPRLHLAQQRRPRRRLPRAEPVRQLPRRQPGTGHQHHDRLAHVPDAGPDHRRQPVAGHRPRRPQRPLPERDSPQRRLRQPRGLRQHGPGLVEPARVRAGAPARRRPSLARTADLQHRVPVPGPGRDCQHRPPPGRQSHPDPGDRHRRAQ